VAVVTCVPSADETKFDARLLPLLCTNEAAQQVLLFEYGGGPEENEFLLR